MEFTNSDENVIAVKDGDDIEVYAPGSVCYYCGGEAIGVMIADTFTGEVDRAVCDEHRSKLDDASSDVEVREFDG